jgi:type II secretory pathway component GspD/PulD (secretin)
MLKVTPTINDENKIIMSLDPEISEQNGQITLTTSTGLTYSVPKIDKRSASTKVVIGNKQTLIIGGLIKDKYINGETKIPFLGDLPGLGYLFKSKKETKDKTELLIFVSPTIINSSELLSMEKTSEFGVGNRFSKDRKKVKELELEKELMERNQKNEAVIRLDLLNRKHKELLEKRKRLEKELMKDEVNLKTLKKTKEQVVVQTE